jgi:hypothetical protein
VQELQERRSVKTLLEHWLAQELQERRLAKTLPEHWLVQELQELMSGVESELV